MKNIFKLIGIIAIVAIIGFSIPACGGDENDKGKNDDFNYDNKTWVDPATQTTQLTGGTKLLAYTEGKSIKLSGTPYEYETWDYSWDPNNTWGFTAGNNKFTWYGAAQGGGGAFKSEWTGYFLARVGFFWDHGGKYTQYKNIYVDYNFKRSNNASASGGWIGIYGWFRNAAASEEREKRIEYYIVDDWFFDAQADLQQLSSSFDGVKYGEELGSFQVDGAVYKIYKIPQLYAPSIDNGRSHTQIFSVRQGRRSYGTISVTEHFKAISKYIELGNIYDLKFIVETFDGNGYLDLTYLYLSQETNRRSWIPAGTPPVDFNPAGEIGSGETFVGLYNAYNSNSYISLSSPVTYRVVNLPDENRNNVLKVINPGEWAVAFNDLSSYKNKKVTITFSAQVKRVGAAGTLNWQINNSDYPSVGTPINNAAAGTWHTMSGTWTGTPSDDGPKLFLSTYQNNSASTTYYISNFTVTVTVN